MNSRILLFIAAMLLTLAVAAPPAHAGALPAATSTAPVLVAAAVPALALGAQEVPKKVDIDIDINKGGGAWYTRPVWIAIGLGAVLLVVLLVALATRSGGTTIIREKE